MWRRTWRRTALALLAAAAAAAPFLRGTGFVVGAARPAGRLGGPLPRAGVTALRAFLHELDVDDEIDQDEIEELLEEAEDGDADAQYDMAMLYSVGRGVPRDLGWAAHWFAKAADQSYPKAQLQLGFLFLEGFGETKADPPTAAAWVSAAANQGLGEAQFQMAKMLLDGVGVQMNYDWAKYWLEQASELKNVPPTPGYRPGDAQYRLAMMYAHGEGVEVSSDDALFWFERAAERGHGSAFSEAQSIIRSGVGAVKPARGNTPGLPAAIRLSLYGAGWAESLPGGVGTDEGKDKLPPKFED